MLVDNDQNEENGFIVLVNDFILLFLNIKI